MRELVTLVSVTCAGILKQSMGSRNRVGIGLSYRPARAHICRPFKEPRNWFWAWRAGKRQPYLSYRPARLHRLAESIPRNRFLGFINLYKYGLWSAMHSPLSHPNCPPNSVELWGKGDTSALENTLMSIQGDFLFETHGFLNFVLLRSLYYISWECSDLC